jgi:uncharacterized membrane protein YeaQ/YmgE (transglycosylase-associated protein family)
VSILAWIVFGFLAGAAAKLATPGRHPRGCLVTIVVGIAGAFVGGLLGNLVFAEKIGWSFSLRPFLVAVAGAIVVLLILQAVEGRGRGEV